MLPSYQAYSWPSINMYIYISAGNLCTRDYSVLRFFVVGAGFTSDHTRIESENRATNNGEYPVCECICFSFGQM